MKKIYLLAAISFLAIATVFTSCSKDEENDDGIKYEIGDTETTYKMSFSVEYTMVGSDNGNGAYHYSWDGSGRFLNGDVHYYGDVNGNYGRPEYEYTTTQPTQIVDVYYRLDYEKDSLDYTIKNTLNQEVTIKNIIATSYLAKTRLYETSGRLTYYATTSEARKDIGRVIPAASTTENGELKINMKNDYKYIKIDTKFYN